MRLAYLILIIGNVFLCKVSAQSGWVREKGEYFLKLSYGSFSSDVYYDTLGLIVPTVESFSQQNIFLYSEYGIAKSLALTVNWAPWKANRYGATNWVQGIGDPILEVKYALPLPFVASLGIAAEIPIGNANLVAQDQTDPQKFYILPTGDGEWNVISTLALSYSLDPEPAYIQGFIGYNYRTGYQGIDFQNQFRYGLEIGYHFGERVWVNGAWRGQSLAGKRTGKIGDFTRGDGTTFNQLHIGINWRVWQKLSLTFDLENYTDFLEIRRNIYGGSVFIFGLALNSTD